MSYSPPGSSVLGVLQARPLEWVAVPFSRGSSPPRDQIPDLVYLLHWQEGSLPLVLPGKPSQEASATEISVNESMDNQNTVYTVFTWQRISRCSLYLTA